MAKTHMTLSDRVRIQSGLESLESFKDIAKATGKNCTSVSREVREHVTVERKGCYGKGFNDCRNSKACHEVYGECPNDQCGRGRCCYCPSFCMTALCKSYVKEECGKLGRPPYDCNGCKSMSKCTLEKHLYKAEKAQKEYVGEEVVGYSAKTIYTYVDAGVFEDVVNLDLPRKVRYKARRKSLRQNVKKDRSCRIGRTYADYLAFRQENPDVNVVEMDSVKGRKGIDEKCLLTIHFTNSRLMLAFIRERNSSSSVTEVFDSLRKLLGKDAFAKLFPVLLTDNGSEFSDPTRIETDPDSGLQLCRLFYCDPRQSQQKGSCENNHEFIRRVIPKGKSMNNYDQEQISLMMSHINSYMRAKLGGRSPYDVFSFMYGTDILEKLGIRRIDPSEVTLKPSLLDCSRLHK